MDHAITRAAGATPRAVGEFQGFIDGEPSVVWADRKNMPQVGDRLFAIPARAAVPRTWSLLLTSENHGQIGKLGCDFSWAPGKHERVKVMEIVEAGAPPAPGVDVAGLVRFDLSGGEVAAQAGQVAVPEDRERLANVVLYAGYLMSSQEYLHAANLGKGGPGFAESVAKADARFRAAVERLAAAPAAPAQAKPLPAAEVPLWDENGEPWNLAAEQVEYERAQASTAGGRQEGGDRG